MDRAILLSIEGLGKNYAENSHNVSVLKDINFSVAASEFMSIFGPNGCGKTTLLNIIAGLDKKYTGNISTSGNIKLSYIFQNYREAIFPWFNALDNISYPLYLKGVPENERYDRAHKLCQQFNVQFDLNAYPYQLSGGQQQLISILRGLITRPDIMLMDEPFSSLDYQTTLFMTEKLQEIWQKTKTAIIFVSHDIDEAIMLSQKIVVLTKKPTSIAKVFENPLPYPRTPHVVGSPNFAELKHGVLDTFMAQLKASL